VTKLLIYICLIASSVALERFAKPYPKGWLRQPWGFAVLAAQISILFGGLTVISGNIIVSALLTWFILAFFVVVSNAKFTTLGEPLVFSDLALIGAVFQHPQFYLSALKFWHKAAIIIAAILLLAAFSLLITPSLAEHAEGLIYILAGCALLYGALRIAPAAHGDLLDDIKNNGVTPTLLHYWLQWRQIPTPTPWTAPKRKSSAQQAPELIIIVQCESFADPAELFAAQGLPASAPLNGLSQARDAAWQWGNLNVSGFGAYTMRTEYGVLFGRNDEELGLRRFDPLLTAQQEGSYALPAKLADESKKGWISFFIHPHDMRFYGRDAIMPAAGFSALIGEDQFPAPHPAEGRYVTDQAVADKIIDVAAQQSGPALLYAVTIENHGPWSPDQTASSADGANGLTQSYINLVQHSDTMLSRLQQETARIAAEQSRPAMLVFFGDHRPSIPNVTSPEGDRHTPYVVLRFDASGQIVRGDHRHKNLSPATLHHDILDLILGNKAAI
jgi:hypothetical protein